MGSAPVLPLVVRAGEVVLEDYDAVLWVLGEESTLEQSFDLVFPCS